MLTRVCANVAQVRQVGISRNCVYTQSEEKREQEVRSLKSINDSFRKFVIAEDLISRYHENEGITYMNIYEFLLDENSLRI